MEFGPKNLFWRQVIGYVQRFLPANIAMDFAQGLYSRIERKEESKYSFNFTYGGGTFFPLTFDSHSGLGYEYCAGSARQRAWMVGVETVRWTALLFQNLCQAKTAILGELCSQNPATLRHIVV